MLCSRCVRCVSVAMLMGCALAIVALRQIRIRILICHDMVYMRRNLARIPRIEKVGRQARRVRRPPDDVFFSRIDFLGGVLVLEAVSVMWRWLGHYRYILIPVDFGPSSDRLREVDR